MKENYNNKNDNRKNVEQLIQGEYLTGQYVISERIVESYNKKKPTLLDKTRFKSSQLVWRRKKRVASLQEVEEYLETYKVQERNGCYRLADSKDKWQVVLTFEAIPQWPKKAVGMWEKYNAGQLMRSYLQVKVQPVVHFNKAAYKSPK